LLRSRLGKRIGRAPLPLEFLAKVWSSAALSATVGYLIKVHLAWLHPIPLAAVVLGVYGFLFFALAALLRVSEADAVLRRILPKRR